ncbi:hypothetical protein [Virgibacillus sp. DJP39]|uniref:hypothetical protein n=1 Tax=Virgibacillus sp. DJP39 TaxID=3409790 RepID=UPI003BB720C7
MTPNSNITKYYQLISEGLCFYFLLLPIMVLYGELLPFWGYLFGTIVIVVILTLGIRYIPNYSMYLIGALILIPFMVYVLQVPPVSSVVLVVFMVWRFIIHESNPDLRNQMRLILYMSFLFIIDVMLFYETDLIWVALIMLLVMVGGYQLSHIIVEGSIGVKNSYPFVLGLFGFIFAGSVIIFSVFQAFQVIVPYALNGILKTVASGIWWGLESLGFTGLNFSSLQNKIAGIAQENDTKMSMDREKNPFLSDEEMNQEYVPVDIINMWTIGITIVILIVVFYFLSRRKFRNHGSDNNLERVSSVSINGNTVKKNKPGRLFGRFSEKPAHEVRLKVFKFEQLTAKKGLGRKNSETIEEWFYRIGIDASHLNIYQKIRYGVSDLTVDEINQFSHQLEEIKTTLNI